MPIISLLSFLRQYRIIPALRLKHRSDGCGTASALPKCSIISGCGTRIVLRGQKPLALCDRCPLLRFAVSATGGAHLCSIQYYLRFWLSSCRTSLTASALRIMRYCPYSSAPFSVLPSPIFLHPSVFFLHSTYPLIFSSSKPATKNAPTKQGGAEKALIGYFSNGQGQRKDTF